MAVHKYLQKLSDAIKEKNGDEFASLLAHENIQPIYFELCKIKNVNSSCKRIIQDTKFIPIISNHLMSFLHSSKGTYHEAFNYEDEALTAFKKTFENDNTATWLFPALKQLMYLLRNLGKEADKQLGANEESLKQEKTAVSFRVIFGTCVSDRSTTPEHSKKKAILIVTNNLFRCYFDLNTIRNCKNLIDTVESEGFPKLTEFPISQLVTYKFYSGQLSAFCGDYEKAQRALSLAFQRCPRSSSKNKRLILLYLIPVEMLLGRLPTPALLEKYSLKQLLPIVSAVKSGNLGEFNRALELEEEFFIKKGIFLLLEKVRMLTYRNLFKKIHLIQGKSDKISIDKCVQALNWMKVESDTEDLMCIFSNLIYNGMIKGYVSHKHKCLVVSKNQPFPNIKKIPNLKW